MAYMQSKVINKAEIAAWLLMAGLMVFILQFKLLPGLLAGLLVFELVHIISPYLERRLPGKNSKFVAVGLLAVVVMALLTTLGLGIATFLRSDSGSLTSLIAQMAQIIDDSRKILPAWVDARLPEDAITLQQWVTEWLRTHSKDLQLAGKEAGRHVVHILVAMIIGGMLALNEIVDQKKHQPFAAALVDRMAFFGAAFKNIVFAQVRISAINASITGLYLAVVLPLLDIHLPFTKTIITVTFLVGLLPVIGNLISNTIIVIVSMSQSLAIAAASLLFLVVIHKLEYFLNARIIGGQIRADAWELLIAMVMMEAAFGITGVVAAPIYYAYIKSELRGKALI